MLSKLFGKRGGGGKPAKPPSEREPRPPGAPLVPLPPDCNLHLNRLKAASRHAFRTYDYARAVVLAMRRGVLGADGIRLRSTLEDEDMRAGVEAAWAKWGADCDAEGGMGWRRFELAVLNSLVIDGEALVIVDGGGDWGYRLRLVDSARLDADANGRRHDGNTVSLGVERNGDGRVVAYHFTGLEPAAPALSGGYVRSGTGVRVSAERVLHVFERDLPGQSRGVPWLSTAVRRFSDLKDYEEAERTAARISARKLGFIQTEAEGDAGDDEEDETISVKPGSISHLDPGQTFAGWDPAHPNTAFADFVNAQLRGAAGGVGLSYFEVGNDLTGVNFSSGRIGLVAQREMWRMAQCLLVDQFHDKVFKGWLRRAVLTDRVQGVPSWAFPAEVEAHRWVGRRYEHIQPREQSASDHQRLEDGLVSRAEIIRSEGRDPDEVFAELAKEKEAMGADGAADAGAGE